MMPIARIVIWVISGHFLSAAVLSMLTVSVGLSASTVNRTAVDVALGWLLVLIALFLACIENIPKLTALTIMYSGAAALWPKLEASWIPTVLTSMLAAGGAAGLAHYIGFGAWVFDNVYDLHSSHVPQEALAAVSVGLAFVLPRIGLRSLRPGRISPRSLGL